MDSASATGVVDSGFDSKSLQISDLKFGKIFLGRSALNGQRGEQAGKFTRCTVGKALKRGYPS